LLGGETAEMPGFYPHGEYDLAGFAVGVVEKGKEITGERIRPGDVLVGIPSSGPHSNGYSLIRKIFSESELTKYARQLLEPTKIYVKDILSLLDAKEADLRTSISAIAHITGGGFYDNIERLLPLGCKVVIRRDSWHVPEIFHIIQKKGNVPEREMYRTLNMGIGLIIAVREKDSHIVLKHLKGSKALGVVEKGKKGVEVI
jgi:phosphoribosylformylglycinamidine cyclo-ligase